MADAKLIDLEEFKASKMPPFRLGELHVDGSRVRLKADCSLTPAAARTLAAQLLVLADQINPNPKA